MVDCWELGENDVGNADGKDDGKEAGKLLRDCWIDSIVAVPSSAGVLASRACAIMACA